MGVDFTGMESSVEGQFCMELALLDSVGGGDCKVGKFNLPETLVKPSPFVCPFDIPLKTKIVCSQSFLWLLNLHGLRSPSPSWSRLLGRGGQKESQT